jgi:hypothetical protein
MTEYPADVLPLYAQGYALCEYLILHGGRRKYVEFLDEGLRDGQWATALAHHYGIRDLGTLQNTWVNWVAQGFPVPASQAVAATGSVPPGSGAAARLARPEPNLIYRIPNPPAGTPAPAGDAKPPVAVAAASQALPDDGWRPAEATPAATPAASAEQVLRPPLMEPSRQLILEWN